jgi:predicted transcriptional regulator YheO
MLTQYKPIVKFLAKFLGKDAQVILFDTKSETILCVENQFGKERNIGDPIRNIERKFLDEKTYQRKDYAMNYRAINGENQKLRSATLFIKDKEGDLTGMLTINYRVTELIDVREKLDQIINGTIFHDDSDASQEEQYLESFENPVDGFMNRVVNNIMAEYDAPTERLSAMEKKEITKKLDNKGIFLIKGSIGHVASILNTSEVTIYRYLSQAE